MIFWWFDFILAIYQTEEWKLRSHWKKPSATNIPEVWICMKSGMNICWKFLPVNDQSIRTILNKTEFNSNTYKGNNRYTVLVKRVWYFAFSYSLTPAMNWYFVLFNNSSKFWSIIKNRDSFGICSSWGFQNCPWKLNLTKICLS